MAKNSRRRRLLKEARTALHVQAQIQKRRQQEERAVCVLDSMSEVGLHRRRMMEAIDKLAADLVKPFDGKYHVHLSPDSKLVTIDVQVPAAKLDLIALDLEVPRDGD